VTPCTGSISDAARYLEDNEEYWPFEGDDWPDEYVGGEVK
jgi:hypothetical protein